MEKVLKMKISFISMPVREFCQWQMQAKIQMEVSSSFVSETLHILTVDMLCLDKSDLTVCHLLRRLKLMEVSLVQPRLRF